MSDTAASSVAPEPTTEPLRPESVVQTTSNSSHRKIVARTITNTRQKLTSSTGTSADFDFELISDYADTRLASKFAVPGFVMVMALFSSFWIPYQITGAWAIMVIITHFALVGYAHHLKKQTKQHFDAKKWTRNFVMLETLYGLTWSAAAIFVLANPSGEVLVILFAIVLTSIAVNGVMSRSIPVATVVSTLPSTILAVTCLLVNGSILNYALAAVTLGAQLFFLFLGRKMQRTELAGLMHRVEKDILISDLEEATTMANEARLHAEQSNIAKSRFLATMSHELRTPLNAIIGFSEVMKAEMLGEHSTPQYKEYSGDIHTSGQHLLTLINELLDLSRIEAGKYDLNEDAVRLIDVTDDSVNMLKVRAANKGIELVCKYDEKAPKVWADERAIRQVVLNLLSNAIKFTPQSGTITITVGWTAGGGQYISVRDTGPGIPQDEIATVLSSFGQGSLAAKTAEQGAGLGLPICQKIMGLHDGTFDLHSKLRVGTEVIVTLPRSRVMDAIDPVYESRNKVRIVANGS